MFKKMLFLVILIFMFLTSLMAHSEEKIGDCLACHQKDTRGIFQAWVNSKHAQKGVDCITCHKSHDEARPKKSAVEPEVCGECHKEKYGSVPEGEACGLMGKNERTSPVPGPTRLFEKGIL